MKEKILFVTKGGEDSDEGFSYVLELAKALNSGIAVLVVYPRQMMTTFEDVMITAAYAEAGDFKSVKTLMDEQNKTLKQTEEEKVGEMARKASENSIDLICQVASGEVTAAITDYLREKPGVDMVLLSPNLSGNKKILDVKKLIKNISKPIVNITMPAKARA